MKRAAARQPARFIIREITFSLGGYLKAEAILILISFIISVIGLYLLKVIGMDNILHSEYFVPSLSTIDYMNEEIAKTATESVFELLDGKTPAEIHNFSARLITRESSQI
mgnify:CR=1 FL=1